MVLASNDGYQKSKNVGSGIYLATSILNSDFRITYSILGNYYLVRCFIRNSNVLIGWTCACKYNERRLEWGTHPRSHGAIRYWDIVWKLEQLDSTSIRGMIASIHVSIKGA